MDKDDLTFEEFKEVYEKDKEELGEDMAQYLYNGIFSTLLMEENFDIEEVINEIDFGNTQLGQTSARVNAFNEITSKASAFKPIKFGEYASGVKKAGFLQGLFNKIKGGWSAIKSSKLAGLLKGGVGAILNHPMAMLGIAGGALLIRLLYKKIKEAGQLAQYPQLAQAEQKVENQVKEDFAGNYNSSIELIEESKNNQYMREIVKETFDVSDKFINSVKTQKEYLDY